MTSFFTCCYKFPKIKSWLKRFWWGVVKNECGHSGLWTLKLTVSQERTDETNWFFDGTLKLSVSEEWTNGIYKQIFCMLIHDHQTLKADQKCFWLDMVKNGCSQSGHGTKKWTDGIKSFFYVGTNSEKLNVDSTIFRWAWSKMAIFRSWDPNICYNLRMNLCVKLIFWMLVVMQ